MVRSTIRDLGGKSSTPLTLRSEWHGRVVSRKVGIPLCETLKVGLNCCWWRQFDPLALFCFLNLCISIDFLLYLCYNYNCETNWIAEWGVFSFYGNTIPFFRQSYCFEFGKNANSTTVWLARFISPILLKFVSQQSGFAFFGAYDFGCAHFFVFGGC